MADIKRKLQELESSFRDTIKSAYDVALRLEVQIGVKRATETSQMTKVKKAVV